MTLSFGWAVLMVLLGWGTAMFCVWNFGKWCCMLGGTVANGKHSMEVSAASALLQMALFAISMLSVTIGTIGMVKGW